MADLTTHDELAQLRADNARYAEELAALTREIERLKTLGDAALGELFFNDAERERIAKDKVRYFDPFNFACVTAHQGKVVVLAAQQLQMMDPEDAIRAAAWLLVGAELAGEWCPAYLAMAFLERIRK